MRNYDEIVPNVYVGNRHALDHSHNFSLIVNCTSTIPFQYTVNEMIRISVEDDPSQSNELFVHLYDNGILEKIYSHVSQGMNVLINCSQGVQRSCAVCACLMVSYMNYTPMKAVKHIQEKRPVAFCGSINFLTTIKKFSNKRYRAILKC